MTKLTNLIFVILFLVAVQFVSVAYAATTTNGMSIPTAHPRIFWTDAKLAQAQAWVSSSGYSAVTSGSYYNSDTAYEVLFTCYVMNNSTACSDIINTATTFNYGDGTGVGEDQIRRRGEVALLTYDWLYDQLTPAQRSGIVSTWNSIMTNQNAVAWGDEDMPTNNYFAGRFRNDFMLGTATMEDNASAGTYLNYSLQTLWAATVDFNDGTYTGSWTPGSASEGTIDWSGTGYGMQTQEGSEYGAYNTRYMSLVLPSAKLLGRNLWEETTGLKATVLQTIYATMPMDSTGRSTRDVFSYGDDESWVNGHSGARAISNGTFMQSAVSEYHGINIGGYGQTWLNDVSPSIDPIQQSTAVVATARPYTDLPLDYYSSGAQYLYSRNNWTSNATALLFQMGTNQGGAGHAHHDAGTFQVFRKGAHLIRETATYGETVAGYGGSGTVNGATGFAHNVPVMGGLGNINTFGTTRTAGPGTVTRVDHDSDYVFAATDITDTYEYPGYEGVRDNPYAKSVVREMYYLRGIDSMVVVDRLETDSASRSTAFMSHCETNPTVSGANVACVTNGQQAKYTALVPASPSITIVNESDNGATADNWQYRIEAENSNPGNVYSYNIYAIEFSDQGASQLSPSIVDSNSSNPLSGTFTITLDANNSITINKGMTSSGGTITAVGVTKSLANGKEVMTITDAGPVWSAVGAPTCNDGVQNGDETGVDCGGSCGACMAAPVLPPLVHPAVNN